MSSRRPRPLAAFAALVLVSSLGLVAGPPVAGAAGSDWPQARGGPGHLGSNPTETTISPANVRRLRPAWDKGLRQYPGAEPVVAGGRLFTVGWTDPGDPGSTIWAYDPVSKARLWVNDAGICCPSTPAVLGAVVVLTNSEAVLAFDVATGTLRWKTHLGEHGWGVVALYGSTVAVSTAHQVDTEGTYRLAFLDLATGTVLASVVDGDPDAWGSAGPTISRGAALMVSNDTRAWTSAGGPWPPWKGTSAVGTWPVLPAARSDLVYLAGRNRLRITDPGTGYSKVKTGPTAAEQAWRELQPIAVDGQRVYLAYLAQGTGRRVLTAFDRFTGARLWSRASAATAAPAVANGVVFVAEGTKGVAAYRATDGKELWRQPGWATGAPPVVANGRLYVGWQPTAPGYDDVRLMMFQLA